MSFLPAVPGLAYCNRGVNGAMVPMLIDLVNSGEIPRPPRAVVVMVGGNDLTNFLTGLRMDARLGRGKSSPPLFAQEVSELLTLVEAKWGAGVRTAVFAVKPMGEVPGGELDKWTREYNAALQVWCMCVRGWGRGSGGGAWVGEYVNRAERSGVFARALRCGLLLLRAWFACLNSRRTPECGGIFFIGVPADRLLPFPVRDRL